MKSEIKLIKKMADSGMAKDTVGYTIKALCRVVASLVESDADIKSIVVLSYFDEDGVFRLSETAANTLDFYELSRKVKDIAFSKGGEMGRIQYLVYDGILFKPTTVEKGTVFADVLTGIEI